MDVATYGATEKGGVNRQALSGEDTDAKNHVVRWAEKKEAFSVFRTISEICLSDGREQIQH